MNILALRDFFMSSSPLPQQNVEHSTLAVIERFNEAFNRHDADLLASLLTDDTVFEPGLVRQNLLLLARGRRVRRANIFVRHGNSI